MADEIDDASDEALITEPDDGSSPTDEEPGARSVAPFVDDDEDDVDTTADASEGGEASEGEPDDEEDAPAREDVEDAGGSKGATSGVKAAETDRVVTRRTVTSKRVTPKGGAPAPSQRKSGKSGNPVVESARYTPPSSGAYARGPSPWWVPTLLFGMLIIGALIIMTNYMGVFGEAQNIRLVIGLVFILGGIITATQYR